MSDMADQRQNPTDQNQAEQLTNEQRAQLEDQELQAKHRAAYQQQMRLRSCPGCGETDVF